MPATWLADALRAGGCVVDETVVSDWKSRGHTDGPRLDAPVGVLGHHTAGPAAGDLPSLKIVRDGRPDLAGPLANLMLSRAGVWVPKGDGNGYLIGIEAESAGTGDWTSAQVAAYPLGVAALLRRLGAGANRFLGHKEWAPSRKPDPAKWPGDMNGFRATVTSILQGDDMPLTDADVAKLLDWPVRRPDGGTWTLSQMIGADTGYGTRIERIDEGSHGGWGYGRRIENIEALVTALQATVAALAASGSGLTADQIEGAVAKALKENVVQVDVDVAGGKA